MHPSTPPSVGFLGRKLMDHGKPTKPTGEINHDHKDQHSPTIRENRNS